MVGCLSVWTQFDRKSNTDRRVIQSAAMAYRRDVIVFGLDDQVVGDSAVVDIRDRRPTDSNRTSRLVDSN